jgi:hypothetical protein
MANDTTGNRRPKGLYERRSTGATDLNSPPRVDWSLKAEEAEVVTVMLAQAEGKLSEKEPAEWLRKHSTKTKGRGAD